MTENVEKIYKEEFDKLLKKDKSEALKLLKDESGKYYQEVIFKYDYINNEKEKTYKIIKEINKKELIKILSSNDDDKYIFLCEIDYKENIIKREDFCYWYFLQEVNFNGATFSRIVNFEYTIFSGTTNFVSTTFSGLANFEYSSFLGITDFSSTIFTREATYNYTKFLERINFEYATFSGVYFRNVLFSKANFLYVTFSGIGDFTNATFIGVANFSYVTFLEKVVAIFTNAIFTEEATFRYTRFSEIVYFWDAIFKDKVNLLVVKFAKYNVFRGTDFRSLVQIDAKKLCENEIKLSKPTKLIVPYKGQDFYEDNKKNLHFIKKILGANAYYDEEDHFYYWYKVYDRLSKPKPYNLRFLDWFILDKCTGYFTKPLRVITFIYVILYTSLIIYIGTCLISMFINIGTLEITTVNATLTVTDMFKSYDIIQILKAFVKIFYFNLITYTTIGYGDISPTGWLQIYAGLEGFFGVFSVSLLLVTLTKKVLW